MLNHGSEGRVHSKECYFTFTQAFLIYFVLFSWINLYFYHFYFVFWWSIEFPQKNIDQSKTGIGDKKLSVELYVYLFKVTIEIPKQYMCEILLKLTVKIPERAFSLDSIYI